MPDFQSQFKTRRKVDFHGRSVSFVDVKPLVLKSAIPIFIAPGWGETPRTFKDLMHLLFDAGFRVISVTHPRQDLRLITKQNISRLEFQKAEIILEIIRSLDLEKVNIVAHSEGAINAVIAAHIQPKVCKDMLLVGPGGLVENESFIELITRYADYVIRGGVRAFRDPSVRARLIRSGIETFKYFLMNPIMSLLEGSAISKTHLEGFLTDLHREGVTIGVIEGLDDIVFPIKKMKSLTDFGWIDFRPVAGDHHDLYACPQQYLSLIQDRFLNK